MFFNKRKKVLRNLLKRFSTLISENDLNNCEELLANNEYLLCYDTLITQIYEYDKEITVEEYDIIESASRELKFETSEYTILKELIRSETDIPKTVKNSIGQIIDDVKRSKQKGLTSPKKPFEMSGFFPGANGKSPAPALGSL